jgi:hypothetical protein
VIKDIQVNDEILLYYGEEFQQYLDFLKVNQLPDSFESTEKFIAFKENK